MSVIRHYGVKPPSSTHAGSTVIRSSGVKPPAETRMSGSIRRNTHDLALEAQVRAEKLRRSLHAGDDRGADAGGYGRLPDDKRRIFKWMPITW